jgi:Domain of unknown function (DUF4136)
VIIQKQFTLIAPLLLLCGCATDTIETAGDAAAIPTFRTFRIQEERYAFSERITDEQRARISTELRGAAVGALEERGYRQVTGTTPADVLVVLGAVGRTTLSESAEKDLSRHINPVDTSVFDAGSNTRTAELSERPPGVTREGDLILYLLDPATNRSLWRASSTGAATTPDEALRKAKATYRAMVRKLPRAAGA